MAYSEPPTRSGTYPGVPGAADVDLLTANVTDIDTVRLPILETVTTVTKTASFTLAAADIGKWYIINSASAVVVTIPTNAAVPIGVGKQFFFRTIGTGTVTFTPAGGVTMQARGGATVLAGQFSPGVLTKNATDAWYLDGDIA